MQEEGCLTIIQNSWQSIADGNLQAKLKVCGQELDRWGRSLSHQIREQIKAQKYIIARTRGCKDLTSMEELREAERELNRLLQCEEDFWSQRAKIFLL